MAFNKNLFIKRSLYLSVILSSSYSIDWSTGWKITLIYYRHVDQSIKLLTCWLVILLNFQPVDYSLYWTSDLSTSHSIERPTCRPVIVLNCRIVDQSLYILVDPSTSDSNDFRLIDQWLLIFLSVKQSVPLSYDKICRQVRQVVLLTH